MSRTKTVRISNNNSAVMKRDERIRDILMLANLLPARKADFKKADLKEE